MEGRWCILQVYKVPNLVCIGKLFSCKIGMTNGPHISVSYCDIILYV
jgi:hypothetical protein